MYISYEYFGYENKTYENLLTFQIACVPGEQREQYTKFERTKISFSGFASTIRKFAPTKISHYTVSQRPRLSYNVGERERGREGRKEGRREGEGRKSTNTILSPAHELTYQVAVLDLEVDVDLVFLPDLKPKVMHKDVHQHGGQVFHTRRQCGHQAGIKWNQIHPEQTEKFLAWCN